MELLRMLGSGEFLRRGGAVLCLLAALSCYSYVSLAPLVSLQKVDFASKLAHPVYPSFSDEERALPLADYIKRETAGKLLAVNGPGWERLFDEIFSASQNSVLPQELRRRISPGEENYQYVEKTFFFRPEELPPLQFPGSSFPEELYLVSQKDNSSRYIRLWRHTYSDDDFLLGVGLNRQKPPADLLYPLRKYSVWLAAFALFIYLAIPWPKHQPGDIYLLRSRVVLSDLLTFVLFFMFFSLPFAIVGGLFQTLRSWWGICAFIWPLAMLGALLIKYVAWYSSYILRILKDRFSLSTVFGTEEILFSEIASYGRAIKTMPKWLTLGTAAAAIVKLTPGTAGRALLTLSAQYEGQVLNLRDGCRIFMWFSDETGEPIFVGQERVMKGLKAAGIEEIEEPVVSSSLGLENVMRSESADKSKKVFLENTLIILGPSVLVILFGLLAGN